MAKKFNLKSIKKDLDKLKEKIPRMVAKKAEGFFIDNFRRQGWLDKQLEPWPARKPGARRNKGRAILVDSGALRDSIRIVQADWGQIRIGSYLPYAAVHNFGLKGTVQVREHRRTASRTTRIKGGYSGLGSERGRGRKHKIAGAEHTVRAHSRKVNMPKRQFIGYSRTLEKTINLYIQRELDKVFNKP